MVRTTLITNCYLAFIANITFLTDLIYSTSFTLKCPTGEDFSVVCENPDCTKTTLKIKIVTSLKNQCRKPSSGSWSDCNAYKNTDNCTVATQKMQSEGITLSHIKHKFDAYFSTACLIHDVCLGTQRYLEDGKESCDLDFRFNTEQMCELERKVAEIEDDELPGLQCVQQFVSGSKNYLIEIVEHKLLNALYGKRFV